MSANESATTPAAESPQRTQWFDLAAIVVCTLAWGTTWFAITKQLGVVDPVVSVTYRFALAAVLLFAWGALRREKLALTRAQHFAALGVGFFTFAVDYSFVYWAEERVTSAVVAVVFASMAFMNLVVFRFAFGQRAPLLAWAAGGLGVLGVGFLSWEEISSAELSNRALAGIGLTLAGVLSAAIGNVYARKGEMAGAGVIASTGWAMAYGAAMLAVFAVATGKTWAFEFTAPYMLSLLHLSLVGSVIAFALYYGLARRRGYATASYISALTPPLAMFVSALFEDKSWGVFALGGVVLVLAGQVLLLRSKRAA
ncbi:MAG: EamA family transporter [Caulobacteraceae bacterium]|nr:EamA family transporter [Caulobacteraceae bacterium]MBK8544110.1 EamA family transporter [Caulobacteraceae bacterium]MBP6689001.1 EamA family transporter [Hyphomonadaceae bacterium]